MKCNPIAIYWRTRYMLVKHYRIRWLTTHYLGLIIAAEDILNDRSPASYNELAVQIERSRTAVKNHGYSREEPDSQRGPYGYSLTAKGRDLAARLAAEGRR